MTNKHTVLTVCHILWGKIRNIWDYDRDYFRFLLSECDSFFMSVKNNKQQGIHEKGSGDVVSAVCLQRDR